MDNEIFNALRKRALGYEAEESTIIAGRNGHEKMKIIKKHIPPDVQAIKLMLILDGKDSGHAIQEQTSMQPAGLS